jgi:long-chain acyl-CoA synthetase
MTGPSARNIADLLTRTATRFGTRPALVTDDRTITWAELEQIVDAVAAGLQGHGLAEGDRVVIVLPTSVEFVTAYLGVLRAGGVAVPLNTSYTAGELARLVGRTGASMVVAGHPSTATVRQAVAGIADALTDAPDDLADRQVPIVVVTGPPLPGEVGYASLTEGAQTPRPQERGGEDVAVMLFTSGSSSDPRAAMLSHRALVSNLDQLMALDPPPLSEQDVLLGVLPLFHVYGLNTVLGQALATGASVVVVDRFDAAATLETIVRHGVTIVPVAPPMLVAWTEVEGLAEAVAGVRYFVSGAAPLALSVIEQVTEATGVTIHQGYGLTEAAPVVTTTFASADPKPGSVGRPLPGTEVMLVDEGGAPVDEGDPGEVVVRGPNLFSGYWPGDVDGPDDQGWWRTGDVAYADVDGDLHLVDRIKDIVIVNGFNVYPREVEEVLLEHPAIAAAAVVGVADRRTGEAVKAVVVAAEGHSLTPDVVAEHCAANLARFKRPEIIEVVDEIPRTATGKIAKGRLRDAASREADKKLAGLR